MIHNCCCVLCLRVQVISIGTRSMTPAQQSGENVSRLRQAMDERQSHAMWRNFHQHTAR